MSQTENRIVFITGCSDGGIGSALAQTFASKGCTVYASTRSISSMASLVHENIKKLAVDVTDEESIQKAVIGIYEMSGHIDILVSNAGLACTGDQVVFDTNVFGFMRLVKAILPGMAKRRKGLIVTITSILGELGTPFTGVYNASKAALRAYTETLPLECQPLGVEVMLVCPGSITSNIANNQSKIYEKPDDSLYKDYQTQITQVMFQSQTKEYGAMPAREFADRVAQKALAKSPPRYMTLGGATTLWFFLKLLPRPYALQMIWNSLSKP